jgi:histidine triad (HIT) family protein
VSGAPSPTFAALLSGSDRSLWIAEDADHVAFLASRPARPGHVVVAPRAAYDQVSDLPPGQHAALWEFVRLMVLRMRARLPCARVCISVIGWAVRHAHVHLLPTDAPGQVPGLDGEPLPPAQVQSLLARLRDGAGSSIGENEPAP